MDEFVLDSVDTYIGLHMLSNPVIPLMNSIGLYSDDIFDGLFSLLVFY